MDAEVTELDVVRLAESQSALCSVFANPKRVLILWSLAEHEKAVSAIAHSIDASLQNTSQHLSLMKAAGKAEDEVCAACWSEDYPVALPHAEANQLRLFEKSHR